MCGGCGGGWSTLNCGGGGWGGQPFPKLPVGGCGVKPSGPGGGIICCGFMLALSGVNVLQLSLPPPPPPLLKGPAGGGGGWFVPMRLAWGGSRWPEDEEGGGPRRLDFGIMLLFPPKPLNPESLSLKSMAVSSSSIPPPLGFDTETESVKELIDWLPLPSRLTHPCPLELSLGLLRRWLLDERLPGS